jgi:hypothetical protein
MKSGRQPHTIGGFDSERRSGGRPPACCRARRKQRSSASKFYKQHCRSAATRAEYTEHPTDEEPTTQKNAATRRTLIITR